MLTNHLSAIFEKLSWVQKHGLILGGRPKWKEKGVFLLWYTWSLTVGGSFSHKEAGQHILAVGRQPLNLHAAHPASCKHHV